VTVRARVMRVCRVKARVRVERERVRVSMLLLRHPLTITLILNSEANFVFRK
jgi:hypothetical protein